MAEPWAPDGATVQGPADGHVAVPGHSGQQEALGRDRTAPGAAEGTARGRHAPPGPHQGHQQPGHDVPREADLHQGQLGRKKHLGARRAGCSAVSSAMSVLPSSVSRKAVRVRVRVSSEQGAQRGHVREAQQHELKLPALVGPGWGCRGARGPRASGMDPGAGDRAQCGEEPGEERGKEKHQVDNCACFALSPQCRLGLLECPCP